MKELNIELLRYAEPASLYAGFLNPTWKNFHEFSKHLYESYDGNVHEIIKELKNGELSIIHFSGKFISIYG